MLKSFHCYCRGVIKLFARIEDGLLILILVGMLLLAVAQIVMRNFFNEGFVWIDPMLRASVLWLSLLGALVATRSNRQVSIDLMSRMLPPKINMISVAFGYLFASMVSAIVAFHAWRFLLFDYEEGVKTFFDMPAWIVDLIIPFAFAVIALRYFMMAVHQIFEMRVIETVHVNDE